ncbi:MAG: hypothetical protein LBL33_02040 [Tannerella sp.]|jgi:hypothetical protein|nr:hypothetical protein [Tannerella sp.]
MKILLVIVLLSFQVPIVFAQCISVELSVTWETGYNIFKKDTAIYIPKLRITYRNLSSNSYYFLKVSGGKGELPEMPYAGSVHPSNFDEYLRWRDDYFGKAKSHNNYANQNFHVRIGGTPLYNDSWYVHSDTLDYHKEYEIDFINSELADIYEYIFRNSNIKYVEKDLYFSPLDITPKNILGAVKSQFVFLKPNEVHIDTYNLIGFKLVEGCFTFMLNQNGFKSYVLVQPIWDNKQSLWVEQKMELPIKVGEYHLYSGSFFTNSVKVDF